MTNQVFILLVKSVFNHYYFKSVLYFLSPVIIVKIYEYINLDQISHAEFQHAKFEAVVQSY